MAISTKYIRLRDTYKKESDAKNIKTLLFQNGVFNVVIENKNNKYSILVYGRSNQEIARLYDTIDYLKLNPDKIETQDE